MNWGVLELRRIWVLGEGGGCMMEEFEMIVERGRMSMGYRGIWGRNG